MKLIHYTDVPFSLEPRTYDHKDVYWKNKPRGLWVSIEGKNDWKEWCEAEEFALEDLNVSYEVKLKKNANILHLKTAQEIRNLCNLYPYLNPQWDDPTGRRLCRTYEVYWPKMAQEYQGIIIAPYQWDCRIDDECSWYYGWDCASGCIWDIDCIEEFNLQELPHGQ